MAWPARDLDPRRPGRGRDQGGGSRPGRRPAIGPSRGSMSAMFTSLNRNNGRSPSIQDTRGVKRSTGSSKASTSSCNFRPGAVSEWGSARPLSREAPGADLRVGERIRGAGTDGPERGLRLGHASVFGSRDAPGGLETGEPVRPQRRRDKGTAIQTSQLITAALFARSRGRGGQHVKVSMLHASLASSGRTACRTTH